MPPVELPTRVGGHVTRFCGRSEMDRLSTPRVRGSFAAIVAVDAKPGHCESLAGVGLAEVVWPELSMSVTVEEGGRCRGTKSPNPRDASGAAAPGHGERWAAADGGGATTPSACRESSAPAPDYCSWLRRLASSGSCPSRSATASTWAISGRQRSAAVRYKTTLRRAESDSAAVDFSFSPGLPARPIIPATSSSASTVTTEPKASLHDLHRSSSLDYSFT